MPCNELVHHWTRVTAYQPRSITIHNTQISGTSATPNEPRKKIVAALLVIRRRKLSGLNTSTLTGRSSASTLMSAGLSRRASSVDLAAGDRAGERVDDERQDEQRESRRDVRPGRQRRAELRRRRGDLRGERVAAVEQRPVTRAGGRTQNDQHRHRLAQCAA